MNNIQISIIIPMFKVADYVTRCIESLESQDIDKNLYEIICINDGSPDNCREIVENLQKKYSNIVLINQENQGVSMARNNGIAIAKGKYILPIDPDDYVLPNTFERILNLAEGKNLDVLHLGFEIFDVNEKSIWKTNYSKQEGETFSGVEGYFEPRGHDVKDPDRSWAILYKKQLLEDYNITYPKDVPYLEDGLFLAKVFTVATKVGFDNETFYQRTTRIGSATNSKLFHSEKATDGFLRAIHDVKKFAADNQLEKEQQYLINHVVAKFFLLCITPSIFSFKFKQYFKTIKKLKQSGIKNIETDGLRFHYKRHISFYNFSKLFFPFYYRFINK
ncbi:glycosyltransferase [Flavobacterium sp.]|jgi:glycosyltransferase involved in cell wall biosynthesis|uniref:glycosyltransferase n=1 Tax=Flavobacterium sp. TaxID=239 RepID=UPI0039192379